MAKQANFLPRDQRWHRADVDWTPQGHLLETSAPSGRSYMAWQKTPEAFVLTMFEAGEHGREFGPAELPSFVDVRLAVAQSEATRAGRPLSESQLLALAASQYGSWLPREYKDGSVLKAIASAVDVLHGSNKAPTSKINPSGGTMQSPARIKARVLR